MHSKIRPDNPSLVKFSIQLTHSTTLKATTGVGLQPQLNILAKSLELSANRMRLEGKVGYSYIRNQYSAEVFCYVSSLALRHLIESRLYPLRTLSQEIAENLNIDDLTHLILGNYIKSASCKILANQMASTSFTVLINSSGILITLIS